MLIETVNFGFGLLMPILVYGAAVNFALSPVRVIGWALGFGRDILIDPSEQARFIVAHDIAVTAIWLAAAWMMFS